MSRAALLLVAAMALSCRVHPPFACSADSQCGAGGRCLDAACAFADAVCSSGWRWDRSAAGHDRACINAVADMAAAAEPVDLSTASPADLADEVDASPPLYCFAWTCHVDETCFDYTNMGFKNVTLTCCTDSWPTGVHCVPSPP